MLEVSCRDRRYLLKRAGGGHLLLFSDLVRKCKRMLHYPLVRNEGADPEGFTVHVHMCGAASIPSIVVIRITLKGVTSEVDEI